MADHEDTDLCTLLTSRMSSGKLSNNSPLEGVSALLNALKTDDLDLIVSTLHTYITQSNVSMREIVIILAQQKWFIQDKVLLITCTWTSYTAVVYQRYRKCLNKVGLNQQLHTLITKELNRMTKNVARQEYESNTPIIPKELIDVEPFSKEQCLELIKMFKAWDTKSKFKLNEFCLAWYSTTRWTDFPLEF